MKHQTRFMTHKTCPRCEIIKTGAEFAKNRSRPDGLDTYCKECRRNLDRDRYQRSDKRRRYLAESNSKQRDKNQRFVTRYLRNKQCIECGFDNSIALDFDHVNPDQKTLAVSEMANTSYSIQRIKQEIRKCRILCSNCHRIHTYTQMGYSSRSLV